MNTTGGVAALLLLSSGVSSVPQNLECPAPLVAREEDAFLDLHPDPSAGRYSQHCQRGDGTREGPTVAWSPDRRKFSMIGFYCDGQAQGRWSFFGPNGTLAREGSFSGPNRKQGAWADYDTSGRKLIEVVYADGRELARQEYPRSPVELPPDPEAANRVAVGRYEAVLRRTCDAVAVSPRPFLGLREELRRADAVAVVRVTGVEMVDRPPGWRNDMPVQSQRIDATVKRVLAGSLGGAGAGVQLWLATAEHQRRMRLMGSPEFVWGVGRDQEVTALVKRNGERLEILNLLAANDDERTDALFTEYARLAALDDRAFMLGLARHLADGVRLAPDRLLWVRWTLLAMDDWRRLPPPSPSSDPKLASLVARTLRAVLGQVDAFGSGRTPGPNLDELPWLIRLLSEPQRRELAAALLRRIHPIFRHELEEIRRADELHPPPTTRDPLDELTLEDIRAMAASAAMGRLMECLSLCAHPEDSSHATHDETLARAQAFVRQGSSR
jgi:hypothetical protein